MKRVLLALWLVLCAGPASAAGFGDWAVLIVAGDNHAHDGSHAEVFDNARRDLARAFAGIGFSRANMAQFSVEPGGDAQETDIGGIANGFWDMTTKAPGGCLVYFTSHGVYDPPGILTNDAIWAPDKFGAMVNNACGSKPAVIVMSACFSGAFVPYLAGPNRIVFTAARPDRTSFGCGNDLKYTFFDQCFLESMPKSGDFPGLAQATTACVAARESREHIGPPSEPQLSIGNNVMYTLRWR